MAAEDLVSPPQVPEHLGAEDRRFGSAGVVADGEQRIRRGRKLIRIPDLGTLIGPSPR